METVKEIIRWQREGTSFTEIFIRKLNLDYDINNIAKVNRKAVKRIIALQKNISIFEVDIDRNNQKDYYIYMAYHRSSGYKTKIYQDKNNEFIIEVTKPRGTVVHSSYTEVIVFEI